VHGASSPQGHAVEQSLFVPPDPHQGASPVHQTGGRAITASRGAGRVAAGSYRVVDRSCTFDNIGGNHD
jgi:hypothetical protein